MEITDAVTALDALAQATRLEIFRLLVRHGRQGLPAGKIAEELDLPNATLSFHLAQLRHSGLVGSRREGRSLIYSAAFGAMDALIVYLTENCCQEGACRTIGERP